MYDSYLSSNFDKGFFTNLRSLEKSRFFKSPALIASKRPEVHIPVTPFMFTHIHGYQLDKDYDIRYIVKQDLYDIESNLLYATAEL